MTYGEFWAAGDDFADPASLCERFWFRVFMSRLLPPFGSDGVGIFVFLVNSAFVHFVSFDLSERIGRVLWMAISAVIKWTSLVADRFALCMLALDDLDIGVKPTMPLTNRPESRLCNYSNSWAVTSWDRIGKGSDCAKWKPAANQTMSRDTCWKRADASHGKNESFPLIIFLNQIQKILQLPIYHLLKTVCIGFLKPTIASDNAKPLTHHGWPTLNKSIAEFTHNSIRNQTNTKNSIQLGLQ